MSKTYSVAIRFPEDESMGIQDWRFYWKGNFHKAKKPSDFCSVYRGSLNFASREEAVKLCKRIDRKFPKTLMIAIVPNEMYEDWFNFCGAVIHQDIKMIENIQIKYHFTLNIKNFDFLSFIWNSNQELFEKWGWTITSHEPFEIRHGDGSIATGQAVHSVIESLERVEREIVVIKRKKLK